MNEIERMIDELKKSMAEKEAEILNNLDVDTSPYARDLINHRKNDIQGFEESYKAVASTPFLKPDLEGFRKSYADIKRDIANIKN